MRGLRRAAGLVLALLLAGGLTRADPPGDPQIGLRLYREGILPSGRPLAALLPGGVQLPGPAAACASCHRRSGYGGTEGTNLVPPITGPALFEAGRRRTDLFRPLFQEELSPEAWARLRELAERPAYTVASLATALRAGRDPAGRALDPLMPRYALSDAEVAGLAAYLRTLAAAPDPGVDADALHFATVLTPEIDPARRAAVSDVLAAYVAWKNVEVDRRRRKPYPPHDEEEAYAAGWRRWVLHTWELTGPPATWTAQLDARYRQQPVFALLGGLGPGTWQPIHDFCEATQVPCVFPLTDLPVTNPAGAYALYLSGGLPAEAETLARHLRDHARGPILQVFRDDEPGRAAAGLLRTALSGADGIQLADHPLPPGPLPEAAWTTLLTRNLSGPPAAALVLWLPASALTSLPSYPDKTPDLYLSSTFLEGIPPDLPEPWRAATRVAWRFLPATATPPHVYRARAWLRARGVTPRHDPLQLATYTTLSLVDAALTHLGDRFSRDFFVETLEREAERIPNPGPYPRLSLGPGQRVAARGCEVVELKALTPDPL